MEDHQKINEKIIQSELQVTEDDELLEQIAAELQNEQDDKPSIESLLQNNAP